ncbi:MAG: endonuclease/exonuclease/phosphatase family protein [Polyangiaceae bacterium]|nr:endonuclease/exonuclease/phosphatase family protein [Polyangiaceae bacterium]MCB9605623.1 endonuclease/exonuclease/phosphatase family protein [Polyangiaceae bacterium]
MRVVSWNVWGVPFVSDAREARMSSVGPALGALRPNVVLLQELWSEADAERVISDLAAAGLKHQVHDASARFAAYGCSGLLIAADRPLHEVARIDYELGRWPHTPYHLDWLSRKAALAVTIEVGDRRVQLVNTHWQAAYRTGNYAPVRLAQSIELADWLRERPAQHALVAGDFNVEPGEHATDWLSDQLKLNEVTGGEGLDRIFTAGMQIAEARQALSESVNLDDGQRMALSDHPAWVADLVLQDTRAENGPGEWRGTLAGQLTQEGRTLRRQLWVARVLAMLGGLLLLRGLFAGWVSSQSKRGGGVGWFGRRRPAVRRALVLATVLGTAYAAYFALGYGPAQARGVEHALARLSGGSP